MEESTSTSDNNDNCCYWLKDDGNLNIQALCIGTGRFLRSVLVPILKKENVVLIQTRGKSFVDYMKETNGIYEIDTVLENGNIQTDTVQIAGAYTLGYDKTSIYETLIPKYCTNIQIIGVGVTEYGLSSHETTVMQDLYILLTELRDVINNNKLCIINTDNVPNNGNVLYKHMLTIAEDDIIMKNFINNNIIFINSMVDRITSHRDDNPLIPKAEPIPKKAIVLLDETNSLPNWFSDQQNNNNNGLIIRTSKQQLQSDIELKLRIANGTHTAIAHTMALCKLIQTDSLSINDNDDESAASAAEGKILLQYLDSLVNDQIIPATIASTTITCTDEEIVDVWDDWRKRLIHPYFGLSTYFITQNGPAKGGIRFGPTVTDLLKQQSSTNNTITVTSIYAYAALLRWLTPVSKHTTINDDVVVYTGWLNGHTLDDAKLKQEDDKNNVVEYADGLRYNLQAGWYEFKCDCCKGGGESNSIADMFMTLLLPAQQQQQPSAYIPVIRTYLIAKDGGNLDESALPGFDTLVHAIATLYARMVAGDDMLELLKELSHDFKADAKILVDTITIINGRPLQYKASSIPSTSSLMKISITEATATDVVYAEVASAQIIDLHTHLLPPTHGSLCLWGIDELLTYHYLVAEYFMTAPPSITPEIFYAKTKQEQADIIWKALFIDRMPISEATRGVVTTLVAFGLSKEVEARDLETIRTFYRRFRDAGVTGAEQFSKLVHDKSGVRYNIMTNIPFDPNEVQYWRPHRKEYSEQYRSALRVDPLLSGDRKTVEAALKASGYDVTLEGARQFLRDWCDTMKPEYMMASTPHNFVLQENGTNTNGRKRKFTGINTEAMKPPGAFAEAISGGPDGACDGTEDDIPSAIDENSDLLSEVLMKVCEERDLPVALKIGAHRGVNPRLRTAGDGIVAFADAGMLGRLCARFPKVRFLATFLSRNNQHEACVLASKFGNLHIYGCWWYCFTPSIVREITKMRIEMLGTAFTAQHSDARVLDQLIYKWSHSRSVIAEVLNEEVLKLCASGWNPTRAEIRRDVRRLFGGSYEEFMAKSLK